MRDFQPAVYILASKKRGTLYVGVTSNLEKRMFLHKSKNCTGFTRRYGVTKLVHVTYINRMRDAIVFEKQLKKWRRGWKIRLIESSNPEWLDLSLEWGF